MKTYMIPFFSLLVLLINAGSIQPVPTYPEKEWQISSPEKQGINAKKMRAALEYLERNSKHNGNKEVLIIRNGYQIFGGENIDSIHNIWSCTKTFTSTVLGLLFDEGRISPDDKAADFEPLLKEYYPDVTFRHFATMTSGYSALGRSRGKDDSDDWSLTVYKPEKPLFTAGTKFAYWDEAQMMFGRVLTQELQQSMHQFLKEKITDKIGMGEWQWYPEKDLAGIPINNGCTGVKVNAKQLARWGWFFLNEGNWNGEQLLSREWIKMATSVQVPGDLPVADTDRKSLAGSGCYGFNWWVNGRMPDGTLSLPGAPQGCYYASGLHNNRCIVIPQWNMVVVRMGEDGHPEQPNLIYGTFLAMMEEAIIK